MPPVSSRSLLCVVSFVNPSNRGSLAVSMLLLYVLMGVPAGYSSSVLYKSFKGRQWQQCTLMTALLFPSVCFFVFLSLNLMSQRYHSTQVCSFHSGMYACDGGGGVLGLGTDSLNQ